MVTSWRMRHPGKFNQDGCNCEDKPARKLIPDLPTWVQYFAIYVAVLAQKQPARIPELMAYAATIATASKKYKWPAWVVLLPKL